jgi:hypothetical protein
MTVPLCMLLNAITGKGNFDGYGTTADTDTANFMLNVKNKIIQNTDASFRKQKNYVIGFYSI